MGSTTSSVALQHGQVLEVLAAKPGEELIIHHKFSSGKETEHKVLGTEGGWISDTKWT